MKKIKFTAIPPEYKQRFEDERLEDNIKRMRAFSIYIIIVQIVLQVVNILFAQKPGNGMAIPLDFYIVLSLLTLIIGIIYCILFSRARKGKIKKRGTKVFIVYSLLSLYAVIQMAFCTLNILSRQGLNSYIIFILMFGMVPILTPKQSIPPVFAAFAYTVGLMFAAHAKGITDKVYEFGAAEATDGKLYEFFGGNLAEGAELGERFRFAGISELQEFLLTDMRANLLIITVMTVVISVIVYRMYVSNFMKSVSLENINANLENLVKERTTELENKTLAAEAASNAKSRFLASIR
ncbi:hypothetical protein FACS1894105_13260 [Clostridia bacterium]|nr:hypothetical protein FACS1894105_13260 [Clostridia bacterium]